MTATGTGGIEAITAIVGSAVNGPAGGNTLMIKRKHMRNMPYHPQIWSIRYEEIWRA
jgi:hypothetical protein